MEGAPRAAVSRVVLARRAESLARCGSRPRALAPLGTARREDAKAVRPPALGNRRRACAASALGRAEARPSRSRRALPVGGPRARSARAGRTRRSRRSERSGHSRGDRRAGRATARPLRRAPVGGEGDPRLRRGDRGDATRDRRRRAASRARPRRGGVRLALAGRLRTTSARPSSSARRTARAMALRRARRWRTVARWSQAPWAACSTRWRTVSPASSSHRGIRPPSGQAIETLLADADLRRRLGSAARAAASERFTWETATAETLRAYRAATGATSDGTSG